MLDLRSSGRGTVQRLLEPGRNRIGVARTNGPVQVRTGAAVACVVVERGAGALTAAGDRVPVDGRVDVFSGAGWSSVLAPESELRVDGALETTVVWCAAPTARPLPTSRFIAPGAVTVAQRGGGTTARTVRTYIDRGPMIVGETLNPPGGWSSWPPHSHTHEEIYLYRFDPPHGFGVHVALPSGTGAIPDASPSVVRDGDVVRILGGEHPVVAAPGCTMYYLWALVGDADTVDTHVDPRFPT